jgi:hypothetical protein
MAKESYQEPDEKAFSASPSPESGSLGSNVFGTSEPVYDDTTTPRASAPRRILDSFKRDPNLKATPKGVVGANGKVFDVEAAALATAESPLARKLKGRHLQMIAIGGSIGMALILLPLPLMLIESQALVFLLLRENHYRAVVQHQY